MPLDPETIKRLQAIKAKPKRRGGGRKAGGVDTSLRTLETWFKLRHRFYGSDDEPLVCENPNCLDPRPVEKRGRMVVDIDGTFMCRYCFIAGYNTADFNQEKIA